MPHTQLETAKRQLEAAIQALADAPPAAPAPGQAQAPLARAATATADRDTLQTLTRLVVGTTLLGIDELERRALGWERQADPAAAEVSAAAEPLAPPAEPSATTGDAVRQALTGWVFTAHDRLRGAPDVGGWLRAASGYLIDTTATVTSEALAAGRRRAGDVQSQELARWIERGRAEEQRSRILARVALAEIARDTLDYLANDAALQELVQSQSSGLVVETLEEVRERAVSADLAVDRVIGRLIGRRAGREPWR